MSPWPPLYWKRTPEAALVDEAAATQAGRPHRTLSVLVDYHRSRRRGASGVLGNLVGLSGAQIHLLASPASPVPDSASVPFARPLAALASVLAEVKGVQHTKFAVFDNDVLLTGANLSAEYFTNRQDRYVLLSAVPELADFLSEFHDVLARHAHDFAPGQPCEPASRRPQTTLADDARLLFERARANFPPPSDDELAAGGCWIMPMAQIGAAGLMQESDAVASLLELARGSSHPPLPLLLSSPYLNPPEEYVGQLRRTVPGPSIGTTSSAGVNEPPRKPTLISAAPSASGFWGARGLRGLIPHMYAALERQLARGALGTAVRHFSRDGWTYHAKGLWLWPGVDKGGPTLTLIGSSNLSERSTRRDIELSACIVTTEGSVRH